MVWGKHTKDMPIAVSLSETYTRKRRLIPAMQTAVSGKW